MLLPHLELVASQVVVEGLHVCEDAFGIRTLPHDHHVFYIHQGHTVHEHPVKKGGRAEGEESRSS